MTLGIAEFNNGGAPAAAESKPLSKMNKGELQALAEREGLDTDGTVKELIARIKEKQNAAQ